MAKLFAILINQRGAKNSAPESIEATLNIVTKDWLRFARNQYFVCYDGDAHGLYEGIKPLFDKDDNYIVSEITSATTTGWASKMAVDWFAKY